MIWPAAVSACDRCCNPSGRNGGREAPSRLWCFDPGVIRFLLARIGAADAVVPRWEGDVEPLHAIYAAHCLPAMEASLRAGRYALRDFLGTIRVDYVGEAELRRVRGAAASLTNVNTPEELAAVGGRFEEPRG